MVDPTIRKKLTSKRSTTEPKIMSILYGRSGDGGVSKDIRDETDRILHNYFGEMSNNEIQELLQEIDDDDDFPVFEMDWYETITNYLEDR